MLFISEISPYLSFFKVPLIVLDFSENQDSESVSSEPMLMFYYNNLPFDNSNLQNVDPRGISSSKNFRTFCGYLHTSLLLYKELVKTWTPPPSQGECNLKLPPVVLDCQKLFSIVHHSLQLFTVVYLQISVPAVFDCQKFLPDHTWHLLKYFLKSKMR